MLKQSTNIKINGYTPNEWFRKYGYSALNRYVQHQTTPITSCPNKVIEITYKIYGIKEWTNKDGTSFWYCWHEWNPETQSLSPSPVTQEDIDKTHDHP